MFSKATYSFEDDKLRLYYTERFPKEIWDELRSFHFTNAPKQKCMFAIWTPNRMKIVLKYVEEITPETTSLHERAVQKSERLLKRSESAKEKSDHFLKKARGIMDMIPFGQPILVGHHSEKRHRKDISTVDRSMQKFCNFYDKAEYLDSKSEYVLSHAEYKSSDRTIRNRIDKLYKSLRYQQSILNDYDFILNLWNRVHSSQPEQSSTDYPLWKDKVLQLAGTKPHVKDLRSKLVESHITPEEAVQKALQVFSNPQIRQHPMLWINHILNRLSFEHSRLPGVGEFEENLSPTIIKAFLRKHGVEKPIVEQTQEGYIAKSPIGNFPSHIAEGNEINMSQSEWKTLFMNLYYEVPINQTSKAVKKPPILNLDIQSHLRKPVFEGDKPPKLEVIRITKEQLKKLTGDTSISRSNCGQYRFRTTTNFSLNYAGIIESKPDLNPIDRSNWLHSRVAIFVTDAKAHPIPEQLKVA